MGGRNCLTDFHGMELTRDKYCSLVKKWQSLIEGHTDVRTTDGYTVRLFCLAFTKRDPVQNSTTTYAQSGHIRKIRKKMVKVMQEEASKVSLRELEKKTRPIFPLKDVHLRKAKVLKKPKFDITRLVELHEKSSGDDSGANMH